MLYHILLGVCAENIGAVLSGKFLYFRPAHDILYMYRGGSQSVSNRLSLRFIAVDVVSEVSAG